MSDLWQGIFLSYASEDATAAAELAQALRGADLEVWFDQSELRVGDAWDQHIREQIGRCRLFIALISAHSDARDEGYFRREWRLAVDRTLDMDETRPFLLPVVIDATPERAAKVPQAFRRVQWTRLTESNSAHFVQRVAALVRGPLISSGTPGESATSSTQSADRVRPAPARRSALAWGSGVFAVAIAAVAVVWVLHSRAAPDAVKSSIPTVVAIADKSVAVLPFSDLSEKHDQEYFADGLAEELIDTLTHVPGLRVTARTSAFYFKGKALPVTEIARQLRVATVLEGSVRLSDGLYRVTAQLVRGDTGEHVWSRTFDRPAANMFELQGALAELVANELAGSMTSIVGSPAARTQNPEAYKAYLEARAERRRNLGDSTVATELSRHAIALDPGYAQAWAELGSNLLRSHMVGGMPKEPACSDAREAERHALALDDRLADAHRELAMLDMNCDWDWTAAREEIRRLMQLDPDDAATLMARGTYQYVVGDLEGSAQSYETVIAKDPFYAWAYLDVALVYNSLGQSAAAETALKQLTGLMPDDARVISTMAIALILQGKYPEARRTVERMKDERARLYPLGMLAYLQKDDGTGNAIAARVAALSNTYYDAMAVAQLYATGGHKEQALHWIDESFARGESAVEFMKSDWSLRAFEKDPDFCKRFARLKLPDAHDPL